MAGCLSLRLRLLHSDKLPDCIEAAGPNLCFCSIPLGVNVSDFSITQKTTFPIFSVLAAPAGPESMSSLAASFNQGLLLWGHCDTQVELHLQCLSPGYAALLIRLPVYDPGRQPVRDQALGCWSPTWEIWIELLDADFDLASPDCCRNLGVKLADGKISVSVALHFN